MPERRNLEDAMMRMQEQMLFLERHVEELDQTLCDIGSGLDEVRRELSALLHRVEQHHRHSDEADDEVAAT